LLSKTGAVYKKKTRCKKLILSILRIQKHPKGCPIALMLHLVLGQMGGCDFVNL
jgi:hypothetical protein